MVRMDRKVGVRTMVRQTKERFTKWAKKTLEVARSHKQLGAITLFLPVLVMTITGAVVCANNSTAFAVFSSAISNDFVGNVANTENESRVATDTTNTTVASTETTTATTTSTTTVTTTKAHTVATSSTTTVANKTTANTKSTAETTARELVYDEVPVAKANEVAEPEVYISETTAKVVLAENKASDKVAQEETVENQDKDTTDATTANTKVQTSTNATTAQSSTDATTEPVTEPPVVETSPWLNGIQEDDADFILICNCVAYEAGADIITTENKAKVCEVIMNRVASPDYPNTVYEVITQKYQFSGHTRYSGLTDYDPKVTASVKDAVRGYLSGEYANHGYTGFHGDGSQNHFK